MSESDRETSTKKRPWPTRVCRAMENEKHSNANLVLQMVRYLQFTGIPENDIQDCFRQCYCRLTKCIASQGEYFEGDTSR